MRWFALSLVALVGLFNRAAGLPGWIAGTLALVWLTLVIVSFWREVRQREANRGRYRIEVYNPKINTWSATVPLFTYVDEAFATLWRRDGQDTETIRRVRRAGDDSWVTWDRADPNAPSAKRKVPDE